MQTQKVICVDFQKDFSAEGGLCYRDRPCTGFLKSVFFPYCREQGIQIAEIISDYRLPRPGDEFECCVPGTTGFESEVPPEVKHAKVWVKCMNSPAWTRANGGIAGKIAGLPAPDPTGFTEWLSTTIGSPQQVDEIVLIGLTLDCCVLCTAQELSYRAYKVRFLYEGVDTFSGNEEDKRWLLKTLLPNWGQSISWDEFKKMTLR